MDWHENNPYVDAEKDFSMVQAIRSHLGDETYLGFDANGGYTAEVAINQSKKLKDLGIKHFEEPVATNNLFALKNVINNSELPISFGEYEKTYMRFLEIIEITGLKIIQPDILNIGGITQLKYLYDYANKKDLIIMPHSPDVGILCFSSLHMYSLLNSNIPHEYSDELCLRNHNIAQEYFNEDILPTDGKMRLTDKPGIGLSLNKKNLIKKKII